MTSATTSVPERARRLDPAARRAQLVAAGLRLIRAKPVDQVNAEDVARAAQTSKALVFHYFPTTAALHEAVLRAAADELLVELDTDPTESPEARLSAGIDAFVAYIEGHSASYKAIARGTGSEPELLDVFEETRAAVVAIIVDALSLPEPPPALRIAIRSWIAMVEEATLHWLADRAIPRSELVGFLQRAAMAVIYDALVVTTAP